MVRTHPVSISKKHVREGGTRVYAITPFTVIAMPGSPHIRAAVRYRYFLLTFTDLILCKVIFLSQDFLCGLWKRLEVGFPSRAEVDVPTP